MIEKPIYLNTQLFNILVASLGDNPQAEEIVNKPSHYLLHTIKIFETPELLKDIIFDIDDLEFVFTDASIKAIKNNEEKIPVRRVIDRLETEVEMTDIINSFDAGCVIDCKDDII